MKKRWSLVLLSDDGSCVRDDTDSEARAAALIEVARRANGNIGGRTALRKAVDALLGVWKDFVKETA